MDRRALLKGAAAGFALSSLAGANAAPKAAAGGGEVMALGWYVIFSRPSLMDRMTDFYGQTLGLPMMQNIRGVQNKNYLWCGEDIVIDLSHHAFEEPLSPREADPATARQIPIFRTDDLTALLATLTKNGASVLPPRPTLYGREAFVVDPMGRLIGFRQRDANSPLAADKEARRRLRRGEAFNPGCAPMPAHLQEMGWVRITVADMDAAKAFYGNTVGLKFLGMEGGNALFDLGDNTTLEIAGGGVARPQPAEQRGAEAVAILRVADFPKTLARLKAAGTPLPYKVYDWANGGFSYIADSEGNLIGLADRKQPASYRDSLPVLAEDLEAQRRWVEYRAGKP
jgi:predicted enzyme related to lactoylglutathione lyase